MTSEIRRIIAEVLYPCPVALTRQSDKEKYYNEKYPQQDIVYAGRVVPTTKMNVNIDVRNFFSSYDSAVRKIVESLKISRLSDDEKALRCLLWVVDNIKYVGDDKKGVKEFWQFAFETLHYKTGDCVAEYEEIVTKEGVKKAKDICEKDLVLSYDFNKKEFVYKPIVKVWNKGIKKILRVYFRNGQHIDVTDEHKFLVRTNQKYSSYEEKQLKDIDLTRWWKRKIPFVREMPYEIKDIEWLDEDLCFVLGHYIAEGWSEKSGYKVQSSGYELADEIIPKLEKSNIPFTEYRNNSGVPCINFLKSDFKEYLKKVKENSFEINLPEEIFHLPKDKLKKFLEGFYLGDGHNGNYPDRRGYNSNKQEVYSTSSEKFAKDIQRIGLQLGVSFHIWKQNNHQGTGSKPIWRVTYNPESNFLKDYGHEGLSEISISYVEEIGEYQTYDWEVKDTHNFVFKNGVITHNCEDGAILLGNLLLASGIPYWKIRLSVGMVKTGAHGYLTYYCELKNKWVVLDWCYWVNKNPVKDRVDYKDDKNYLEVWFSWNEKFAFSKGLNAEASKVLGK